MNLLYRFSITGCVNNEMQIKAEIDALVANSVPAGGGYYQSQSYYDPNQMYYGQQATAYGAAYATADASAQSTSQQGFNF